MKIYKKSDKKKKNTKLITISAVCISIVSASVIASSLYGEAFDNVWNNTSDVEPSSLSETSSMSSEEIDDIIQQIAEAYSSPNYVEVLNQVIQKAILMGNTELQQYAENKKAIYIAQSQINEQNAMNAAIVAKNPDIQSVDSQISQLEASSATTQNIIDALPQRAGELFATLKDADWAKLSEEISNISTVINLSDPLSLSEDDKNLVCAVLCQGAVDQGLFKDEQLSLIQNYEKAAMTRLETNEQSKYSGDTFTKLKDSSINIARNLKSVTSAQPSQIVLYNQEFILNNPIMAYNGTLMIALNDAYQFINATYAKSDHNATITLTSEGKRVEITAGKNTAYVNDKSNDMSESMLNFNNVYYIPVEFFAKTYDVKYIYSKDLQAIVMYGNLNQLKNPYSANKLIQAQ